MRKLVALSFAMAVLAILYSTVDAVPVDTTVQSRSAVGSTTKKITTPKGSTTKKQSTTPHTTRLSTTKPSTTKPTTKLSTTKPTKPTTKPSTTKPTRPTTKPSTTKPTRPTTKHSTTKPTRPTTKPSTTKLTRPTTKHSTTKPTKPTTKPSTTKPTTKHSTPSASTTTTYYTHVCNMNSVMACDQYVNPSYTARVNAWQQGIHFNAQSSSTADIETSVLYEDDSTFTFQFDPNMHNYIGDCTVQIEIYDTIYSNTHLPLYTYTCNSKLPTKPIKVDSSEVRVLLRNNLRSDAFDFSILVTLHDHTYHPNITWYIVGPTIGFIIALTVLVVVVKLIRRRRFGYRSF